MKKNHLFSKKNVFIFSILFLSKSHAINLGMGLTPPSKQRGMISYSGLLQNKAEFPEGSASTSMQELNLSTPVFKTDLDAYSVGLEGKQLAINPSQNGYSTLSEVQLRLAYSRVLDGNRLITFSTRFGSASDQPFADSTVNTFGATGYYSFSNDETSRWLWIVDYANDRPILNNLPLPGFAYFYNPNKNFKAVLGAPFASMTLNFDNSLSLDFFTVVPWVFKSTLNYNLDEYRKFYLGFNFSQLTYFILGRQNLKDRLFYDEKKIFVGAKSPLSKSILADLEMGRSFDRALFMAEEYRLNPNNPVRIENAFYLKLSLLFLL
jgi:hypothetical protein